MDVPAVRRDVARSAGDDAARVGGLESLDAMLARADYLVLTLPLTAESRGLIGEARPRPSRSTSCPTCS